MPKLNNCHFCSQFISCIYLLVYHSISFFRCTNSSFGISENSSRDTENSHAVIISPILARIILRSLSRVFLWAKMLLHQQKLFGSYITSICHMYQLYTYNVIDTNKVICVICHFHYLEHTTITHFVRFLLSCVGLTHLPLVQHVCVSEPGQHCFR